VDTARRDLRKAAGLAGFRFHDLRHTVVTDLLSQAGAVRSEKWTIGLPAMATLHPAMATLYALKDGLREAREGRRAYF